LHNINNRRVTVSYREKLPGWLGRVGLVMLAFGAISCGDDNPSNPPTTGSIQVTASTTGAELDADGYTVTVDGAAGQSLAINGSVTFTNQTAGNHNVELSGVAANCTVAGDNPRAVAVTAGSAAPTTFNVACAATAGDLEVTTVTTGDDIDADGYSVAVDGGTAQAIDASDSLTVTGLTVGDHDVELGDVASNCTVGGDNPRIVAVSGGGTATTQFDVTCTLIPPATGDVKVVNVTTGTAPDDSYTVTLDIVGTPQLLAANDSLTLSGLTVGDHMIELGDVAPNCTVAGDNPRTVTVTGGGEVRTQFDVTCPAGSLDVTSNTWGLGLDSGYDVVIDAGTPQAIGANATVGFSDLSVGDHTVELTGIASNCNVDGANPRTLAVTDGAGTTTTFDVFCFQTLSNQIVFETDREGDSEIYLRSAGNPEINMTKNSADDRNPDVASNGTVIAFESNRGGTTQLWRMSSSGIEKLSATAAQERDPSYAGDLSGLAFTRGGEIWKANANGSSPQQLSSSLGTNDQPAYSPDGQWVLFRSDRDGNEEIYVVNVATGVETNLTGDASADGKPTWWYDGSKVLWTSDRGGNFDVFVADFDALTPAIGAETNLTNNAAVDGWPDMRGNGASIAFATDRDGTLEIYTMDSDGSNQARFAGSGTGADVNPSWSP
jgi:Tol biopolymer transport system component